MRRATSATTHRQSHASTASALRKWRTWPFGTSRTRERRDQLARDPLLTFTQAQLENGASRLYLGGHFGFDNLQGQLLGLAV